MPTVHANSATQALARLPSCAVQRGFELPYQAIRQHIGDAIHLVSHLSHTDRPRYVRELIRVRDYNEGGMPTTLETLFVDAG